jgi:hypothetical protein
MQDERLAARVGVVVAAVVLALTAVPYAVAGSTAIAAYYRAGFASPIFVSLLAVVCAITLVSASRGRADPPLAAGIAVTLGAFATVIALLWAVPAREVALGVDLSAGSVLGVDAATLFAYHPHSVVLTSLLLAIAAAVYARVTLTAGG